MTGHSFCMGAATAAARVGMEDSLIQTLGRLHSPAYHIGISGHQGIPSLQLQHSWLKPFLHLHTLSNNITAVSIIVILFYCINFCVILFILVRWRIDLIWSWIRGVIDGRVSYYRRVGMSVCGIHSPIGSSTCALHKCEAQCLSACCACVGMAIT